MLTELLLLIILYFTFLWATAWIKYFNNLDARFGDTIWRWSYDYPVKGQQDISNIDDIEVEADNEVVSDDDPLLEIN